MKTPLQLTWDLDSIFKGGSDSKSLHDFLHKLEQDLKQITAELSDIAEQVHKQDIQTLVHITNRLQELKARMKQAGAFNSCLTAQNIYDKKATLLTGRMATLRAQLVKIQTLFEHMLNGMSDSMWDDYVSEPEMQAISFSLNERRQLAREKLSPEQEALIGDLSVDGYHGWAELYNTAVSHIRIETEENGEVQHLSAGQAHNRLSNPDRDTRENMFTLWEEAWGNQADFCADALNHIAGFRLKVYEHRGWDQVLKEPLAICRMSQETLDTMWNTIVKNKPAFVDYLNRKAKLLGVEKLSWCDVDAPLSSAEQIIPYDQGAEIIVNQFGKFSSKMADFAARAFEQSWIEAEDRAGKRPGGFCTSFPLSHETRIFMTYAGTASNLSTLAHELGHGYHQHVMDALPVMAQEYAMNVAETASTFAEMIVSDSAVKEAKNKEEKLALLEDKINRSLAFFMNIHARFLFETRFYEQRKQGLLSADELCKLMEEAQKEAFCDALSSYHPHFWASKLHFYITGVPFYNFPYTFGYLFSTGIYARALEEGETFAAKYDALLRDTGSMTVEELAMKHLGVDLTQPDFWQSAIDVTLQDVKQFMEMTE